MAPWALSRRGRWSGREADHSPPSCDRSRMVDLYLHSPICLHDLVLN
jgi:hypothetical protein